MWQQLRRTGAPDRVYQTLRIDLRRRNPIRRDRQSEIPSPQQRAEPRRGLIRITVRRRMLKRRLPHPQQIFNELLVGVRIGARRAQATGDKMKWPFEFYSTRSFEFVGMQNLAQHRLDVPAGSSEDIGHAINQRHGWLFRNQLLRELSRDVTSGRRMIADDLDHTI